jgi:glycosyltransferase involved in cell wall biosynthesis
LKKKIFIISRFKKTGGAAIASNRLYNILSKNKLFDLKYIFYDDNKSFYFFLKKKIFFVLEYGLFKLLDKNVLRSINILNLINIKKIINDSSSVINIHWFHSGLLSLNQIAKIKNPLVLTLHDSWIINKTSHYNTKFKFYKTNILQTLIINLLDKWILKRKRKINNIKCLVSPSNWLKSLVLDDPHFSKFRIEVIPNPLDTDIFKPVINKNSSFNILIYFQKKSDFLKGGDLVYSFINSINLDNDFDKKINFNIVGNSIFNKIDLPNVTNYGFIHSELELVKIYQSSNICISFSRSENLPQFLTQAASCGLPLMGFNVDGIPEVVVDNYNGLLIDPYDLISYKQKLKMLLNNNNKLKYFSKNSRKIALEKWNQHVVSDQYFEIFKSL